MNEEIDKLKSKIKNLERINESLRDKLANARDSLSAVREQLQHNQQYLHNLQQREAFNNHERMMFHQVQSDLIHQNHVLLNKEDERLRQEYITKKKAADRRHGGTRIIKEAVIAEWNNYKEIQESLGKSASKNAFAQKAAEKYSVSYNTIRKNWLQGL